MTTNGTYIGIAIGKSTYVVIKDKKIIRSAKVCGAVEAYEALKPKTKIGEALYIKVNPR
jgi:hypothetical protein